MTANNAVLTEAVAAGRFRADLYHRLAVVVLTLPPSRTRGEDVVLLAEALLRHYTVAHGVPPKRLSASTHPWLQEYSWPGNVRELRHMMERVTLLHVGAENDATTLARLCLPQAAPKPSVEVIARPHEPAPEETLPAQAVQIRQALAQAGGNVTRAAQLLGVSRDTVRYRMQRCGIARPRLGAAGGPNTSQDAVIEKYVHSPEPAWQHTPVAVLALELTWPEASSLKFLRSDLWIETARWEETIGDKVQGFGGRLVQRVGSRRVWVFGVPQVLEQLPQRAVHSALAIRQLLVEASPGSAPLPHVRLAVHFGAVRVDSQAADPGARVRAVGETLTLPVRLLEHVDPGTIVVTPEVGRLVDGWVALEAQEQCAVDLAHMTAYTVVGVNAGRKGLAGHWHPTSG